MCGIRKIACAAMLVLAIQENCAVLHAGTASFTGLGDFPGGRFESAAYGISPDGTVVTGYGYNQFGNKEAFRWTAETGLIGLGDLPGGETLSDPSSVSANGDVVVGVSLTEAALVSEGFVWSEPNGMIGLGDLSGGKLPDGWGNVWSIALDVSWDGQVVVGVANGENGFEAFKWTAEDGMVGLGDLDGGFFDSGANGVSADGLVIVGLGATDRTEATRWTVEEGIMGLGFIESDDLWSVATSVAADGRVVIGLVGHSTGDLEAFRWTEAGGMVGLGDFPGGIAESEANDVSADGAVIVGSGLTEDGPTAFIWDDEHGMRDLRDVLISEHGLSVTLEDWVLETAYSISADGKRMAGWGINPNGQKEAFMVELTPQTETDPLIGGSSVDGLESWFLSDWFGAYNTTRAPWIFHAEHGFVYRDPGSTNESMFVYDDAMSTWCWTSESDYPFLYVFDPPADNAGNDIEAAWVFYFEESIGPRAFGVVTGASAGEILFFDP